VTRPRLPLSVAPRPDNTTGYATANTYSATIFGLHSDKALTTGVTGALSSQTYFSKMPLSVSAKVRTLGSSNMEMWSPGTS
jgi:hypothetical protein